MGINGKKREKISSYFYNFGDFSVFPFSYLKYISVNMKMCLSFLEIKVPLNIVPSISQSQITFLVQNEIPCILDSILGLISSILRIFAGNMHIKVPVMRLSTKIIIKPIHQAPIHFGSVGSKSSINGTSPT